MSEAVYIVISPVRNEEKYLAMTIESVRKQTIPPRIWMIVDDGSSDNTGAVAAAAAAECDWIQVVRRADRGYRKPGGGVVEAFYEGFKRLGPVDWQYLVKLDGDVSF